VAHFFTPKLTVINGAHAMGIDIQSLGFDTKKRVDLISNPDSLISHISLAQEQSRKAHRFTDALEESSRFVNQKLAKLV
jgi:hypothetical protein